MPSAPPGLIADIGGTFVRFALVRDARVSDVRRFACRDFAGPAEAAAAYLAAVNPPEPPVAAAFAAAGPERRGRIVMTNLNWVVDAADLRTALALSRNAVVNDFAAVAHAVPALGPDQVEPLQSGDADAGAPTAVIGPGTGLGTATVVPTDTGVQVLAGEGGHVTFAPRSADEASVAAALAERFGHVSAERIVSGAGLAHAHAVLSGRRGAEIVDACETPETVVAAAHAGDVTALRAARVVTEALATVASDMTLTLGARGGVILAGGLIGHLGPAFDRAAFLARFSDKGRFSETLRATPVHRITADDPALIGLAALVGRGT
jgi:glucokinase